MKIPSVSFEKFTFANINSPTKEQIHELHQEYGFSMLNLEDYLYKTQVPMFEMYEKYSLIVLDLPSIEVPKEPKQSTVEKMLIIPNIISSTLPAFPKAPKKKRIRTGEVDFFIGKDYLVVLHDKRTPQIDEIFELCNNDEKVRKELMEKGPIYLFYRIADVLVDSAFSYVSDINETIDAIDKKLAEKASTALVEDISVTRRNIVVFETMVKPTLTIFSDLEKGKYKDFNGSMSQYWGNILDHLQKIWDRLEDNKELIAGIATSYESLLTVKTNETVRILTIFTAILLPLTLLASIYGMNIHLPLASDPQAFWLILMIMGLIASTMVLAFKLRDWL